MHKIKKMIQKKNKKGYKKDFKKLNEIIMNNKCMVLIKNMSIILKIFGSNVNIFYNSIF